MSVFDEIRPEWDALKESIMEMIDENARLREACAELLKMAEHNDPEWIHWPEMHEELRKLGVKC